MKRLYSCCICHKILDSKDVTRLVKQKYGICKYKQFANVEKYDFCPKCHSKIQAWIEKHRF